MDELESREKKRQKKERWKRTKSERFSRWYGRVKGKGILKYLEKGWGESRWKRVTRFRLRNEMREGRY